MRINIASSHQYMNTISWHIKSLQMAKNVAPSGFPTARSFFVAAKETTASGFDEAMEVFSRKSCVTAMPMLAKDREVRSQARKVLSD